MDGAGRLPRSVKAMTARPSSRLPVPAPAPQLLIGSERQGRWLRRSRHSQPLSERLPRHLGSWLALGFLSLSLGSGLVIGGQYQAMQDNYGPPRDIAARLLGFGLDRVT